MILEAIFLLILALVGLKVYISLTTGRYKNESQMDGKVVIVTGAKTGIGVVTAKDLADRETKVIVACSTTM